MIGKLVAVSILCISAVRIYGQVEDSATAGVVPLSVGASFSYFDTGYESTKSEGFGAFIDYSPLLAGSLGVEGEGRWLKFGGAGGFSEYNYLVGPRYRFYYKKEKYQPYAKFLLGAGEINFPYDLGHGGYFAMAGGGGIDIAVNNHWKFRADYELQYWPNALNIPGIQTGATHPNGVSVGFNYRIFRSRYQFQPH